jgi:hypothetical protein
MRDNRGEKKEIGLNSRKEGRKEGRVERKLLRSRVNWTRY